MAVYEVVFKHTVIRTVTATVEADSEEEAKEKVDDGDFLDDDELFVPEESISIEIETVKVQDV